MTPFPTPSAQPDDEPATHLDECLSLIRDIASDCRPCPGGYTLRAKELLARHEQEREVET